MTTFAPFDTVQITEVAEEIFAAMIDGEPGLLFPWTGGPIVLSEPLFAWVEMHDAFSGRVVLSTETSTAHALVRGLLGMTGGEAVSEADLVDAFGEVANVVGGNLKALLPTQGRLTLPVVGRVAPSTEGLTRFDGAALSWCGRPLDITVWRI